MTEFIDFYTEEIEARNKRIEELSRANVDMLEALEAVIKGRPIAPPPRHCPPDGIAWRNWHMFEMCRAAIKQAHDTLNRKASK